MANLIRFFLGAGKGCHSELSIPISADFKDPVDPLNSTIKIIIFFSNSQKKYVKE